MNNATPYTSVVTICLCGNVNVITERSCVVRHNNDTFHIFSFSMTLNITWPPILSPAVKDLGLRV